MAQLHSQLLDRLTSPCRTSGVKYPGRTQRSRSSRTLRETSTRRVSTAPSSKTLQRTTKTVRSCTSRTPRCQRCPTSLTSRTCSNPATSSMKSSTRGPSNSKGTKSSRRTVRKSSMIERLRSRRARKTSSHLHCRKRQSLHSANGQYRLSNPTKAVTDRKKEEADLQLEASASNPILCSSTRAVSTASTTPSSRSSKISAMKHSRRAAQASRSLYKSQRTRISSRKSRWASD